ncbi:MAG: hypothetical protein M1814_000149 [Vezdaea aestivalis]|nr:MAG: hypothetical protein M1814_000149 [Vezdaea aestivalis]
MPGTSSNAASNLMRWKPAIIAIAGASLIIGAWYFNVDLLISQTPKPHGPLQRCGAIRDPNRTRRGPGTRNRPATAQEATPEIEDTFADEDENASMSDSISPDSGDDSGGKNLLYRIAEDQARREGYCHRGVTCNSCGAHPIRGVRYRCANCYDYDLCEGCEAGGDVHTKTHLFYKVRVPAPFLGNGPNPPQKPIYPGKVNPYAPKLQRHIAQALTKVTGFSEDELDSYLEQFRCIAATDCPPDPAGIPVAIDRKTFGKVFVPSDSTKPAAPGLIYDRVFTYYDTNQDGLISFEEFVKGLASMHNKEYPDRMRRIFNGYDLDGDGYVERKDFLRMFRAYFILTRSMSKELIAAMEEEVADLRSPKSVVLTSKPLSSAFDGRIVTPPHRARGEGKEYNDFNDLEPIVGYEESVMRDEIPDYVDRHSVIGDGAVRLVQRDLQFIRNRCYEGEEHDEDERNLEIPDPPPLNSPILQSEVITIDADDDEGMVLETVNREAEEVHRQNQGNQAEAVEEIDHEVAQDTVEPALQADDQPPTPDGDANIELEVPHFADSPWPPPYITEVDVKTVFGPDFETPLLYIRDPDHRALVNDAAEDRILRDSENGFVDARDQGVHERWRRRRFYLDEEEGVSPPADYNAETNDLDTTMIGDEESVANISSAPSARAAKMRSRSSSKVRFEDDISDADADVESRSNYSTSSRRSIPLNERWGGYEIPQAERDIGKEVLYQVLQQGCNELLDILFGHEESKAMDIFSSKKERAAWRHWFPEFEAEPDHLPFEKKAQNPEPESLPPPDSVSATQAQNSQRITHVSGIVDAFISAATANTSIPSNVAELQYLHPVFIRVDSNPDSALKIKVSPLINLLPLPALLGISGYSVIGPRKDNTLPQNRPDATQGTAASLDEASATFFATSYPQTTPIPLPSQSKPLPHPPSLERLLWLYRLEVLEARMRARGGPGKIDFSEFEVKMREFPRLAFLESWVEMGSF